MHPDRFHLHSDCRLMFHVNPISKFSHGLKCFGEASFFDSCGTLLLKQKELIFVPDSDQKTLHLIRNQILKYSVRRKGDNLRISVLYCKSLLPGSASELVSHYHFLVRDGKKEDWQF